MPEIKSTFTPPTSLLAQLARLPEISQPELKAEHLRLFHAGPAVKHRVLSNAEP